ncbi:unnamed protein product [Linum tenue]|uniref:Multipolar spindle 1 n=1 Tax=Linum tenue TaxID=586396 RepID=A0AAV0L2P1_9ROSI|nr:unnamed protein product [Linum tenue]
METNNNGVSKGREFPPDFRTYQRMAASEPTANRPSSEEQLKLAVAISLLQSKLLHKKPPPPQPDASSGSDALRWKRKAKDRKQEIVRLREDLKEAEDASSQCDLFPQTAVCKCYFFDDVGKLRFEGAGDGSVSRFDDVIRRRFFRQGRFPHCLIVHTLIDLSSSCCHVLIWVLFAPAAVRMKQRRRNRDDPSLRLRFTELSSENEVDQLRASVDFLVELCDGTASPMEEANFANWSHQAVDSILESLRKTLPVGENMEVVEGIVTSLIVRLLRRICCPAHRDGNLFLAFVSGFQLNLINDLDFSMFCIFGSPIFLSYIPDSNCVAIDHRPRVQHLLRKLGGEPFIGQRTLLSVCERISTTAENLLCIDPFDDTFPNIHQSLFIMIELVEFLISDHLQAWSTIEGFDHGLMEGWVTSFLHARKTLQLLECRHGLYVLYMDRVANELAKQVCRVSPFQRLNQQLLHDLFN